MWFDDNLRFKVMRSASNDVPSFLFSFGANARPAVFFVGKEVPGTFQIGDYVHSSSFNGLGASSHCFLDINSAFEFHGLSALLVQFNVWGIRRLTL